MIYSTDKTALWCLRENMKQLNNLMTKLRGKPISLTVTKVKSYKIKIIQIYDNSKGF